MSGNLKRPPMLRRGDVVGLVAPASPVSDDEIALAVTRVEALGLRAHLGEHARERNGYLAGTDEQRAADFNAMAHDADVRAIFALRGGYGTMRILDALDYDALRGDPKIVLGYSDMTAILNAIAARGGIVTFHGPVAANSAFGEHTIALLQRALMSRDAIGALHSDEMEGMRGGRATGRLVGGNLSLVAALEGTPYAVRTAGAVLFLEDVHEAPYRVDRMLTQLSLSGALSSAAGIVFGKCTECEAAEPSLALDEIYRDRIGSLRRPSVFGAQIGHIDDQWIVPIGMDATLDADARTLTIAEAAVS